MSQVLDAVRAKYPQYADVADADLTLALGNKYPTYLESDPQFKADYTAKNASVIQGGPSPADAALGEQLQRGNAGLPPAWAGDQPEDPRSQAAQMWEDVNQPMVQIIKPLSDEEHAALAQDMTKGELRLLGAQESLGGFVNFFTSPMGVATLGMGALPKLAQRAVALGFTAAMASSAPEIASELGTEFGKPETERDQRKIGQLITDAAQTTGFATLGALGAGGGAIKPGERWYNAPVHPVVMAKGLLQSVETSLGKAGEPSRAPSPGGEGRGEGGRNLSPNLPAEEGAPVPPWEATDFTPQTEAKNVPAERASAAASLPEQSLSGSPARAASGELAAEPPPAEPVVDKAAPPAQSPLAGAETITGSNVRQGTVMPAESGAIPGPTPVSSTGPLEQIAAESDQAIIARTAAEHRPAAFTARQNAIKELAASLSSGDTLVTASGERNTIERAFNENNIQTQNGRHIRLANFLAQGGTIERKPPVTLAAPREAVEISAEEAAANKAYREQQARRQTARAPAPEPMPESWTPPRAEPVEPVPLEESATEHIYNIGDAVKEAETINAPPFSEAVAAIRKGKSPAQVVADWGGGQEYAALHNILESAAEAKGPKLVKLKQAYQRAFSQGEPNVDRTLAGIRESARSGRKPAGGLPETASELIERQWEQHARPTATIDREATMMAQESADFEAFTGSLSFDGKTVKSHNQPLGELRGRAFVPTPEAERLPPDYQEAVLRAATPEIIGLGGAVPGEFRPGSGSPTGIKNATVDAERVRRGLPPAMDAARRSFGDVWDTAMARIDADPGAQDRLIAELQTKPRALTDVEDALLLHRQIDLQNHYGSLTRDLAHAYDDAKSFPNRLEAVAELKLRVAEASDDLLALYDVNKAAGTETGRGLAARKLMANEDFSLAAMELEKRAANEGRPLTDAERTQLVKQQAEIERLQKAFDEHQAKVAEERAGRMTDEAIADMQRELKSRPTYDSRIIKIAEEIVTKLERQAVKSDAAIREMLARASAGVDPTLIYHLGVKGAALIARKGLDFAKFADEMVRTYGDKISPMLQAAWERANLHLENEGAKYGDKAEPIKRLLRKQDETGRRENVIRGLKQATIEGQPLTLQGDYIRRLMESFIAGGLHGREALVDAIHGVLRDEIGMDLTRRDVMEAMSGYGKFKALNPDAIKAEARDIRGQLQQVLKLEDIQNRKPLPKTGIERREASGEERRLIQQVNEAKRRFGVVVSDPARQLKSALDAVRKRLTNQISDLEYQIATKARTVKTKTPSPFDAGTKLLEARRDELKSQLDELVPRPEITDAQRAQAAMRTIERSIADYERRIAGGDVSAQSARPKITTPDLEALRARQTALREQWTELRDAADPGRSERASLSALKARLTTRAAEYAERLARKDFAPRVRREVRLDAEALKLKADFEMAKANWQRGLIHDRLANQNFRQKAWRTFKEALNLPRAVMASWDVSAVLRQGGFIALGNPLRAARSLGPMFRALASERQSVMVEQEILHRPNAADYKRAGLYLAPHESLHLSAMEEAIMSRLAGKIPGLRASNRAYITFLNKLRADSFDALKGSIESGGPPLNPPELQAIANYINVATGRGNLYKFTAAAEGLATAFFAPRLVASRFQLLAGEPLYRGTARTRGAVAREYAKFLTGIGVVLGLGAMAGATVEADPRSSDFGKLKFGNTRVDLLGGLTQATVLLARLTSGESKSGHGQVHDIRGPHVAFGQGDSAEVAGRFLRSKLSPVVGAALDVASGKNVVGQPVNGRTMASNMLVPLSFQDIYSAMQEQGVPKGTAFGVLSLFGAGLQTYQPGRPQVPQPIHWPWQPAQTNTLLQALSPR